MDDHPLPLSGAQAMAFTQAFDDRQTYISEQPGRVRMRVGFEESVPYPGCPYCWRDAEQVQWHVLAHETWTIVKPCGHWFVTERPVIVHRHESGWETLQEWLP